MSGRRAGRPVTTQGGIAARERAVAMALADRLSDWEQSLTELDRLADTAGADVVAAVTQKRDRPEAATYLGKGKAEEARDLASKLRADLVIADADLMPVQQRNLERIVGLPVIDRVGLILDIFAQRARSNEGKLQVELAQLSYMLPRLAGRGVLLSRLGGGIGTRGPGETKLEVDRRRIRHRMGVLKKQVKRIAASRGVQRRSRKKSGIPLVCLVGYTNSGKSTLFNALSGADVFVQDKLFATLDPTIRRARLPAGETILLSDTVGFIRNLPTQLIAAFRATLEEVTEADILIHLLDASHPDMLAQKAAVEATLAELEASDKTTICALNKSDLVQDKLSLQILAEKFQPAAAISAKTGEGLPGLLGLIAEAVRAGWEQQVSLAHP